MSFGSPTPIEIVVASPDLDGRPMRMPSACSDELDKIPCLRDVQIQQTLDYPTVPIDVDRQKAGLSGVDAIRSGIACW